MMTNRKQVHDVIKNSKDKHLARVREYMAQPSVSREDEAGVKACAELLKGYFLEIGCQEAEVAETPRLPSVWAHYDAGASKTLAVYGYFDTNLVGTGWTHDPYDVVLAEHKPFKEVVYGCGSGSKGGFAAFLNALESIIEVEGTLPVNLMFLIEGEEFLGSGNIPILIERYRDKLETADGLVWNGPAQNAIGDVSLSLGNKGCLHIELQCTGDHWGRGPQGGTTHSSTMGVVDHPVWRLVHALSTLYDPETNKVLVEGFYDDLREPNEDELLLVDKIIARFAGQEASAGALVGNPDRIKHFRDDMDGRDAFMSYCFQPTMNINGLRGGFTGPGTTLWTLPNEAYCTIDHRIPPDLDPDDLSKKIRAHLDAHGYGDIGIEVLMNVTSSTLSVQDPLAKAGIRVLEDWGIEPVIWPRKGASGPPGYFSTLLGLNVLSSTGIGHATGHGSPDEFLVIEGDGKVGGLIELEQSYVDLLYSYANYPNEY
jgi:acetylornithine deacetylase/succinyl-diaminopimelate desuccinylase-like protein